MYLSRLISPLGVKVTRLARGLPVGGDLEYADDVTLARALEGPPGDARLVPPTPAHLQDRGDRPAPAARSARPTAILTLYTPALGKIEAKAKGVRKTTSRMSGHLQPLTRCMLQLVQGHAADVVTGCETLESFQPIRDDLGTLSRALYMSELIDRITPGGFTGVRDLPPLRRQPPASRDRANRPICPLRFFEMRLLDQTGFRPELESALGAGPRWRPSRTYFAPQAGGAVCRACVPGHARAPRVLTLNAFKVLRLLQRGSYNDVARLNARLRARGSRSSATCAATSCACWSAT